MRKLFLKLVGIAGVAAILLGFAGMVSAYNYVDVNATSVDNVVAYITNLFSDVSVFIWLAIGIPLGFWVIKKVISLVRVRA